MKKRFILLFFLLVLLSKLCEVSHFIAWQTNDIVVMDTDDDNAQKNTPEEDEKKIMDDAFTLPFIMAHADNQDIQANVPLYAGHDFGRYINPSIDQIPQPPNA